MQLQELIDALETYDPSIVVRVRPKAAVARVLRPPVELRRPELAEVGLGGVVARGIREGA